jgi:hypothetical protein
MKRVVLLTLTWLALGLVWGQIANSGAAWASDRNGPEPLRLLTGQVMNQSDAPLPGSIVYVKNTKTLTVRTFIADDKGNYRFPALSPNVDYEVYAEFQGRHSNSKTLSSFDSRPHPSINLKIDMVKK